MPHFKDYYYYLKNIRWILNNSLADTTIGSSSTITSNIYLAKEGIENVTISDLEKWSEHKVKRLAEETSMD
jgi:predicted sulfurtransferase